MTEIERRALLGNKEAQRECTENGIALPCPCCGKPVQWDFETKLVLHDYKDCILGKKITPLPHWNSRPIPPIGRCGECKHFINMECTNEALSTDHEGGASYSLNFDEYDYCSYFEPKGV